MNEWGRGGGVRDWVRASELNLARATLIPMDGLTLFSAQRRLPLFILSHAFVLS